MKKFLMGVIVGLLLLSVAAMIFFIFDPVDGCLDQGGAWDYEKQKCYFEERE